MIEVLLPDLVRSGSILDLGCGSLKWAGLNINAPYAGVDVEPSSASPAGLTRQRQRGSSDASESGATSRNSGADPHVWKTTPARGAAAMRSGARRPLVMGM